jgi:Tol biopolymer transport system component
MFFPLLLPVIFSLKSIRAHGSRWMFSPDGKTIVFELLGDLYQMSIRGGEARCIACGLPFDSQPAYSPDGSMIAFVSDRSGNENLWVAQSDGTTPRQISTLDDNSVFISPAWAAVGKSIYISRFKPDLNAFELFQYYLDGRPEEQITHAKSSPDTPKQFRTHALGAAVSPDGRFLYYEAKTGFGFDDDNSFPLWHIDRRDLKTGETETVVNAHGSAFRPEISPDGKSLVYATRLRGKTGLRIRDLVNDEDQWLLYPIQSDDQEASASRELIPRYAFTPDSRSILLNYDGLIHRLDIASRKVENVPFQVHVDLPMWPYLRQDIREESGPVRARLVQTPSQSPDGQRLVFSALAHVYEMSMTNRVTASLDFVVTARVRSVVVSRRSFDHVHHLDEGRRRHRLANSDGTGTPKQLTDHSDFYRNPVFAPDGKTIVALRSSNYEHNIRYMEFSPFESEAIQLPVEGGSQGPCFRSSR